MGYIAETKWHKKQPTQKWLNANGFKYSKDYSDKESDAYIYIFPVHKYKLMSLLECVIVVYLDNGDVIVKVQDSKTKESYPQFSYDSQGNHKNFIEKIEKIILEEFSRLGIKEVNDKVRLKKKIQYSKFTKTFTYHCPTCGVELSKKVKECDECEQPLFVPTKEELESAKKEVYIHE